MKEPKTPQQIDFCNYYLTGGMTKTEAAIAAGYSEATAAQAASRLAKEFEEYLVAETQANLKSGGVEAYAVMNMLMRNAKQDSIRLKAAQTLLEFGGYKPAEKVEMKIEQKSDEEIDAQLISLVGEAKAKEMGLLH